MRERNKGGGGGGSGSGTDAGVAHFRLEQRLKKKHEAGTLTEDEEDRILEEMGDLWWDMSEPERAAANRRAAERQSEV